MIRQRLQVALGALGVTIRNQAATDAATTVRVTLSQTARQGLWVAEVQQGPETRVAMVTAASPAAGGGGRGDACLAAADAAVLADCADA